MRAGGVALGLLVLAVACQPDNPIKVSCRDSMDCLDGRTCSYGICGAPPVAPGETPALDGGHPRAPADCNGSNWQPVTLTSTADAVALLVGRWIRCGGGNPPSLPDPTEFTAEGRWYVLDHQSDGAYTRSMTYGKWGHYRVTGPDAVDLYDAATDPDADAGGFPSELSQIHFSLDPFIMQFDPALYTPLP